MQSLSMLARELIVPHRFRLPEYHRLLDSGVFGEEVHVELLAGVISEMSPQGRDHGRAVSMLGEVLMGARRADCRVRIQLPLSLGEDTEPEPDLAIVTRKEEEAGGRHPRTALLVVEVSEDSLQKDRLLKGRLYARAGVPEYWVVDLIGCSLEVYTQPGEEGYKSLRTLQDGQVLTSPAALPELSLPVAQLFD
jgi:Uma2 family endonuclease